MSKLRFLTLSLIFFLLLTGNTHAQSKVSLAEDAHCVAYRVSKRLLFSNQLVLGENCDIRVDKISGDIQHTAIRITIPIKSFDSGDEDRDESVTEVLKAETHPNMVFFIEDFPTEVFGAPKPNVQVLISGKLNIGGKDFPVESNLLLLENPSGLFANGTISTAMSDFEIEPPSMLGGLTMSVEDEFEILYNIDLKKIK